MSAGADTAVACASADTEKSRKRENARDVGRSTEIAEVDRD
jgi:hypothetical protein